MDAAKLIELKQKGESFDTILTLLQAPEEVLELDPNSLLDEDTLDFLLSATKNIHEVVDEMEVASRSGSTEEILRLAGTLSDTFEMIKDSVQASSNTD